MDFHGTHHHPSVNALFQIAHNVILILMVNVKPVKKIMITLILQNVNAMYRIVKNVIILMVRYVIVVMMVMFMMEINRSVPSVL